MPASPPAMDRVHVPVVSEYFDPQPNSCARTGAKVPSDICTREGRHGFIGDGDLTDYARCRASSAWVEYQKLMLICGELRFIYFPMCIRTTYVAWAKRDIFCQ